MRPEDQSPITSRPVHRVRAGEGRDLEDTLVVEEPLEIRIAGRRYTATMRTPGHDTFLAEGLLFTEGVIAELADIEKIDVRFRCREQNQDLVNVVDITLHDDSRIPANLWERSLISNSSCGLCGKATVDALSAKIHPLKPEPLPAPALISLDEKLRATQPIFDQTGGLHGVALFTSNGQLLAAYEDIGRHNATDKVIGWALEQGIVPTEKALILMVSGRASFEIIQKAVMARIGTVAAVSAASSLAVDLAQAMNLNLVGFLRSGGYTIYHQNRDGSATSLHPQGFGVVHSISS